MKKAIKTIHGAVMVVLAIFTVMTIAFMAAGFRFTSSDGALMISTDSTMKTIPYLGYVISVPGLLIAVLMALALAFVSRKVEVVEAEENEDNKEDMRVLTDRNAELEIALAQTDAAVECIEDRTLEAEKTVHKLNSEIAEAKRESESVRNEADVLKEKLNMVLDEQKSLSEKHSQEMASQKSSLEDRAGNLEEALAKMTDENELIQARLDTSNARIEELEEMLQMSLEAEGKSERAVEELTQRFDSLNEDYELLYSRYITTVEFLAQRNLASPDACSREKLRFAQGAREAV